MMPVIHWIETKDTSNPLARAYNKIKGLPLWLINTCLDGFVRMIPKTASESNQGFSIHFYYTADVTECREEPDLNI